MNFQLEINWNYEDEPKFDPKQSPVPFDSENDIGIYEHNYYPNWAFPERKE